MIEKVFYNVFIFGTIISICISPLLIFLYKNKYKYKLKNIYKILAIILLLLILPINNFDFSNMKNVFKRQDKVLIEENYIMPLETEIILETANTVVEVSDSINIKNNNLSNFAQFVPYLWISVSIIFLFYNLISYWIYIYKNKKNSIEVKVPEIEEKIIKICREMKLKNISYAFSKSIATPMVVGIFKKKIMLPENILKIENYEMILVHEIVHIKNKDIECKFILLLINAIYWFNPVIYKFIDQVEEVLELKCDEIVLENRPQIYKIKYAQVLLNQIEENRNLKYRFSLNFANKRRNIMKRFSNIVDKNKKKNMLGVSCTVASAIIISSAIIFSFPNINFATIQEEPAENEVANNLVEQDEVSQEENIVNESSLENVVNETEEEQNSNEIKNEVINSKDVKVLTTSITNVETGEKIVLKGEDSSKEEIVEKSAKREEQNKENVGEKNEITISKSLMPNLIYPLEDYIVTSRFGKRSNGFHTGIDFNAVQGTPIRAAGKGIVIYSGYKGSYGNLIILENGNGMQTYYAHCDELFVKVNESVEQGDIIATVGMTGNATGPQLHFETRINRIAENPSIYLP